MKYIERAELNTLKKVMGTPDIKVITGVRRSGKSTLLAMFEEYVAASVQDAAITHVNFSKLEYEPYREYHALNEYIEGRYDEAKRNFVFIDEIQLCDNFELAINSLHASGKYDIYLTGSNAFLLSSDLATLFAGRVFPIEVYPFSFAEYLQYYDYDMEDEFGRYVAFDKYVAEGGFAGSYIYDDQYEKYRYISNIYDTLVIRDIVDKYKIENAALLMDVGEFLMDNMSRLTTANNIANVLNSARNYTNNKTVSAYLDYFCRTFAFYKVKRYDVEGKNYLRSQDKYYLCDHALKIAKLGTKNANYGSMYENIVAIELMRRGYEVYVGTLRDKEIDFVAKRGDEKIYVQVSYDISEEKTFGREVGALLAVKDAYPKLLVARTRQPEMVYEGVRVMDIADFLIGV
ncbi:ATP-binding protein [Candidatus Saccharibacteria bacterium]|nr:ATP-binding protein [Candidatus Saccharibacteria bacterium]